MSEGKCSDSDREDSVTVVTIVGNVKDSHFTPSDCIHKELPVKHEANESGTEEEEQTISQENRENDDAKSVETQAEHENDDTSADQEQLNNGTAGRFHEQPKGDCAMEITSEIESDKQVENTGLEITVTAAMLEVALEDETTISNMADQLQSVCIEMDDITEIEGSNIENSCDKSPSAETTTYLYFSEGDSTEVESDVCRICHCSEEMEILISPCLCTGSVKFVHHTCLMSWLQRAVMSKCELCLYPLAVKRKRKPFSKWRLPEDKPFPILWLFTFVVAMTLNVASIAKDGSQRCVSNPCIIFYVLGSAGALLGLAFFYHWLRKTMRYMSKWIALNQEWTLVGPADLRTQMGQTNLAYSTKSLSETDTTQEQIA